MADCPLADECPSFSERIEGMGCQYYGDRGGKEWCNHYNQPIDELKTAPVVPGEEVIVDVTDIHESGSGVGHTEEGFVVLVDGVLPEARARVRIDTVKSSFARGDLLEKLPQDADVEEEDEELEEETTEGETDEGDAEESPRLGSRDNFWGG
ncbi:MAG: TRAM domain-containing protein [Halobacteriaceae archaeon]